MPNRKIFIVLILCIATITAVWIVDRGSTIQKLSSVTKELSTEAIVPTEARGEISSTLNWQKILSSVHTNTSVSTTESLGTDDTSLTAKLAQDSFGRYLLAVKNGGGNPLAESQTTQIAQDTLSLSNYTTTQGPQYVQKNIHLVPSTSASRLAYYADMTKSLSAHSLETKKSTMDIVTKAVNDQSEDELKKLDSIITENKKVLSDFIKMSVPGDAVFVHLEFVNALSNIIADTEAMRFSISDPVRGLAGINNYLEHVVALSMSMKKGEIYLKTKGLIK